MNVKAIRELIMTARELVSAGFPSKYFTHSGSKQRADEFGLMDVENEDLTDEGLIAKMEEWQESEKSVPAFVYDDAVKLLKKHGKKIPSGITREASDRTSVMKELVAVERMLSDARM